jgi:hypothetical protein
MLQHFNRMSAGACLVVRRGARVLALASLGIAAAQAAHAAEPQVGALQFDGVSTLLTRGTEWAASGSVSVPLKEKAKAYLPESK